MGYEFISQNPRLDRLSRKKADPPEKREGVKLVFGKRLLAAAAFSGSVAFAAAAEFVLNILAEKADGVSPASLTVTHLTDIGCAKFVHLRFFRRGRRHDVLEFILRDKRDDIEVEHTHCPNLFLRSPGYADRLHPGCTQY